jgi:hypothetical protein
MISCQTDRLRPTMAGGPRNSMTDIFMDISVLPNQTGDRCTLICSLRFQRGMCLLEAENLFLRHQLSNRLRYSARAPTPLAGIWQSREHIGEPGLQIIRNGQRPDRRLYDLYNRNWLGYGRDSSPPPLRSARTRAACAGFLAGAQIRHRVDLDQAVRAQGVDRHRQPGRHPRAAQASSELFAVGIEEHLAILSR